MTPGELLLNDLQKRSECRELCDRDMATITVFVLRRAGIINSIERDRLWAFIDEAFDHPEEDVPCETCGSITRATANTPHAGRGDVLHTEEECFK